MTIYNGENSCLSLLSLTLNLLSVARVMEGMKVTIDIFCLTNRQCEYVTMSNRLIQKYTNLLIELTDTPCP